MKSQKHQTQDFEVSTTSEEIGSFIQKNNQQSYQSEEVIQNIQESDGAFDEMTGNSDNMVTNLHHQQVPSHSQYTAQAQSSSNKSNQQLSGSSSGTQTNQVVGYHQYAGAPPPGSVIMPPSSSQLSGGTQTQMIYHLPGTTSTSQNINPQQLTMGSQNSMQMTNQFANLAIGNPRLPSPAEQQYMTTHLNNNNSMVQQQLGSVNYNIHQQQSISGQIISAQNSNQNSIPSHSQSYQVFSQPFVPQKTQSINQSSIQMQSSNILAAQATPHIQQQQISSGQQNQQYNQQRVHRFQNMGSASGLVQNQVVNGWNTKSNEFHKNHSSGVFSPNPPGLDSQGFAPQQQVTYGLGGPNISGIGTGVINQSSDSFTIQSSIPTDTGNLSGSIPSWNSSERFQDQSLRTQSQQLQTSVLGGGIWSQGPKEGATDGGSTSLKFFLPDCIEDEIGHGNESDHLSRQVQQQQQQQNIQNFKLAGFSQGSLYNVSNDPNLNKFQQQMGGINAFPNSLPPRQNVNPPHFGQQNFQQPIIYPQMNQVQAQIRVCSQCLKSLSPIDKYITQTDPVILQDGTVSTRQIYTHLGCHMIKVGGPGEVVPFQSQQTIMLQQPPQPQPQPQPILSQVHQLLQLLPEMLIMDFQLLHPKTMTSIFHVQGQPSSHFFIENGRSVSFNKLLCQANIIPFNTAIVSFKWDFFRDSRTVVEGINPTDPNFIHQFQSLPQRPQSLNNIKGQVNFTEMYSFNDKNITINLNGASQSLTGQEGPTLTMNFNYQFFIDENLQPSQQHQQLHLIRNMFVSFNLPMIDFENLKKDTLRLLQQNPALLTLLKQQNNSQERQNHQASNVDLHQLFKPHPVEEIQRNKKGMADFNELHSINFSPFSNTKKPQKHGSGRTDFSFDDKESRQKKHSTFKKIHDIREQSESSYNKDEEDDHCSTSQMDSLFLDGHNEEEKDHNGLTVDHRHLSHDHPAGSLRVQDNSETHPSYTVKMTKVGIEIQNLETNNEMAQVINRKKTTDVQQLSSMRLLKNKAPTQQQFGSGMYIIDQQNNNASTYYDSNINPNTSMTNQSQASSQVHLNPNKKMKKKKSGACDISSESHKSGESSSGKKNQPPASGEGQGNINQQDPTNTPAQEEEPLTPSQQQQNELKGKVVELAKHQHGSKQLQKILARASPDLVNFAIEECLNHVHELMVDQYGNYFCQKLLQSSSSTQRHKMLIVLKPHILRISCDKKGTHSMQCLIEMINMPEEEEELKDGIKNHILDLAFDQHGTHVLQKVLLCLKEEHIDFIFNPILENFIRLSMDQNGLCVIKKIVSKVQSHDKRTKIGQVLSDNVVVLVQDPFGNYAVQQALDNWPHEYCIPIFSKLEPHLMQLSVQKFSSNVIERVLEKSYFETVERFAKCLCDIEVMKGLIKNTYGFYVMQKLVQILKKHKASVKPVHQAVQETIQYATDKSLRQKWQGLLQNQFVSQQPSQHQSAPQVHYGRENFGGGQNHGSQPQQQYHNNTNNSNNYSYQNNSNNSSNNVNQQYSNNNTSQNYGYGQQQYGRDHNNYGHYSGGNNHHQQQQHQQQRYYQGGYREY